MLRILAATLLLLATACAREPTVVMAPSAMSVVTSCEDGSDNPCKPEAVRQRGAGGQTITVPGLPPSGHAGF